MPFCRECAAEVTAAMKFCPECAAPQATQSVATNMQDSVVAGEREKIDKLRQMASDELEQIVANLKEGEKDIEVWKNDEENWERNVKILWFFGFLLWVSPLAIFPGSYPMSSDYSLFWGFGFPLFVFFATLFFYPMPTNTAEKPDLVWREGKVGEVWSPVAVLDEESFWIGYISNYNDEGLFNRLLDAHDKITVVTTEFIEPTPQNMSKIDRLRHRKKQEDACEIVNFIDVIFSPNQVYGTVENPFNDVIFASMEE